MKIPHEAESAIERQFVDRWVHTDHRPSPVEELRLHALEGALQSIFPDAYRRFVAKYGAVATHAGLLNTIVEHELDLADPSEFFEPEVIAEESASWSNLGLPAGHVAFAADSQGNLFCFRCPSSVGTQCADEVVFFDHEAIEVTSTGLSFSEWLKRYSSLPST